MDNFGVIQIPLLNDLINSYLDLAILMIKFVILMIFVVRKRMFSENIMRPFIYQQNFSDNFS